MGSSNAIWICNVMFPAVSVDKLYLLTNNLLLRPDCTWHVDNPLVQASRSIPVAFRRVV